MLVNTPPFVGVLVALSQSPFEFQLTSSRFFDHEGFESRWDFFVEKSDALVSWLESNGFDIVDAGYVSGTSVTFWKHRFSGVRIDVPDDIEVYSWSLGEVPRKDQKENWDACVQAFIQGREQAM